ncbi:MAG: hypothetical protein Q8M29_16980, partial [Bacteroidota bacterium]|nr:hypothetical protein [Bacteroidota bacterium]
MKHTIANLFKSILFFKNKNTSGNIVSPERNNLNYFHRKTKLSIQTLFLLGCLYFHHAAKAQCPTLATSYASNNGSRGVMFNITATNGITITSFDANLYGGTTATYEIYYKSGSYVGSETNAAAWTLAGTVNSLYVAANNVPTPIPITLNVYIPPGNTYGFYVTNTASGGVNYTSSATTNITLASDANMTVVGGVGKSYPFGSTYSYRLFNGTVHYCVGSCAVGSSVSATNVACNGMSTGSATVTPSGGTAPYTYSWAPSGGTGATASGLSSGTYTCTITDANACSRTQTVTITQPTALTSSISSQTNVSCNGGSNGAATVLASGGTGSLTYAWAPSGGTGATASGLASGTYTCTITDANTCSRTQTVTITQPTALTSSISSQTNVSCNGGSNGAATVLASGGTGSLTYAWAPSGGTGATASGLASGTYTCTITDANTCSRTQTV